MLLQMPWEKKSIIAASKCQEHRKKGHRDISKEGNQWKSHLWQQIAQTYSARSKMDIYITQGVQAANKEEVTEEIVRIFTRNVVY